jgi:hypothetical protein
MANTKISNLPSAGALAGTEPLPIVQGGATVQTTVQDIANLVNLISKQNISVEVSASITAALNQYYIATATATFTDPTPSQGKGFIVLVRNGTATIGGTAYATAGTLIYRYYHSGAWVNYEFSTKQILKAYFDTLYLTAVPNLQDVTNAGATTTNSIDVLALNIKQGTEQVGFASNGQIDFTPDTTTPANKTTLLITQPTANNNIVFKDESGTVAFLSDIPSGGGSIPHATASGTDTYTATISGVTAYNDGDAYLIRFPNGNTTSATLNIYNGTSYLGAIDLYRNNDGLLIGGDIIAGGEMLCIYNSTTNAFQLIGTAPNTLLAYVTNADSVSITKGMPVYAFGGTGDRMTVKRALNTSDATSAQTIGLVLSSSISAGQKGLIIIQGQLDGLSILPTSTFADGDPIYLGATAGSITNVKPSAPNHLVYLGTVTTASNGSSGRMYVRVQNGYELNEIHDVSITSVADNQVLQYDSATSLWKNETLAYLSNSLIAYSFWANNTNATANATANTFKAIAKQTYSGTITWTGTTAPSGATQHSYSWQQVGNVVTFTLCLIYATQGGALTQVLMTLPSDMPSPVKPDGISATNDVICMLVGQLNTANTISANQHRASLRIDASSTSAFQLAVNAPTAGNHKSVWISGTYLTA